MSQYIDEEEFREEFEEGNVDWCWKVLDHWQKGHAVAGREVERLRKENAELKALLERAVKVGEE